MSLGAFALQNVFLRLVLYTTFALVAFAFNSILCRLALRGEEIDAAGFTAVRLSSGAVALVVISYFLSRRVSSPVSSQHVSKGSAGERRALTYVRATDMASHTSRAADTGNWLSAFFLFAYAVCFSFAYIGLHAGTGALILFGSVQMTMISIAIFRGERPSAGEWIGFFAAFGGLVYLVLPGLASPPLKSSVLMATAGMAWGVYTLRGRRSGDPLADTTGNFVRSLPMMAPVVLVFLPNLYLSSRGILLAVLSGAVASGVGYTVWYAVLKHQTATRAAILQLAVPLITAGLGLLLLNETATLRLAIAAALILGGILITIFNKSEIPKDEEAV